MSLKKEEFDDKQVFDKSETILAVPYGIESNALGSTLATQFSLSPSLREERPNGDYSASWTSFTHPYLHIVSERRPDHTFLRLGPPVLTIAVTTGPNPHRIMTLAFHNFTTFNWYSVAHESSQTPNGMRVTIRLLNRVGGELRRDYFDWRITCLPCYDHQTVRPYEFGQFPEFYRAVEQVEITYNNFYCRHCDTFPCQPRDVPFLFNPETI